MLPIGKKTPAKRYFDNFDPSYIEEVEFCGRLIQHYQFEEAWTLLNRITRESIPLLLNKSLCLIETDRYAAVVLLLERILLLLGPPGNSPGIPASPEIKDLHEVQRQQVTYMNPVSFRYVDLFPQMLRDSVLRLLVDCYSDMGNTAKVIEIAMPLRSKCYRNVLEALDKHNGGK